MQLTNLDVINANLALEQLATAKCDARTALKLARMVRQLAGPRADIDAVRERLLAQHAPGAGDGGDVTITADMAAQWAALMGEPVDYAGPTLTEDEVGQLGSVTPQTLVWLAPLIVVE